MNKEILIKIIENLEFDEITYINIEYKENATDTDNKYIKYGEV